MGKKEEDFIKRLLVMFKAEAEDHIKKITAGLLELEKTPAPEKQTAVIDAIFREAHSLKGAARSVDISPVEDICQAIESIFSALKKREALITNKLFDTLHQAMDIVEKIIAAPENAASLPVQIVLQQLGSCLSPGRQPDTHTIKQPKTAPHPGPAAVEKQKPLQADTIRISASKLDSLMLQAEEMVSLKMTAHQRLTDLTRMIAMINTYEKELSKDYERMRTYKHPLKKSGGPAMDELPATYGRSHAHVKAIGAGLNSILKTSAQEYSMLSGMVDNLIDDMKKVVMLPLSSLIESFPKMVREISREQGKQVEIISSGEHIEIDKRILEEIKDPLTHILRNCIDHGIEPPEERRRSGKQEQATIRITITQEDSNRIGITIRDDGRGIDTARVKQAALKQGLITDTDMETLDNDGTLALIFKEEFSTSPIITNISGRGLGLAIAKEKVGKAGGTVEVATTPMAGTSFRLELPVSIATFRGILVNAGGHVFVIPTASVERVVRVRRDMIKTVENRDSVSIGGHAYSFIYLADALELPRIPEKTEKSRTAQRSVPLLLLDSQGKQIAFGVDEIINEQEILFRGLGKQLYRVRNIAGATVLGSGKVVPILNVPDLMKSAVRSGATPVSTTGKAGTEAGHKSILLAEDSITARTLFKNILESAGYRVKAAVDGLDALTALKSENFDLVVSDVQMPRMSGFELTAKIRADKKLSDMPVVLVTGLESREDRERGIDAGANAYIVKSSFDQSNLLEVIGRLI